jgi:hypothetical protein
MQSTGSDVATQTRPYQRVKPLPRTYRPERTSGFSPEKSILNDFVSMVFDSNIDAVDFY